MDQYFETVENGGDTFPLTVAHDTMEAAIEYADTHEVTYIYEIGGNWDEFEKCAFCGEWVASYELDKDGFCEMCLVALRSHGEI